MCTDWEIPAKLLRPLNMQMTLRWCVNLEHIKSMCQNSGHALFSKAILPNQMETSLHPTPAPNRLLKQTSFMWFFFLRKHVNHTIINLSLFRSRAEASLTSSLIIFASTVQMSPSSENQTLLRKGSSAPCWLHLQAEFLLGGNFGHEVFWF